MREHHVYTFTLIHVDGTKVSVEGNKETVPDVLEDFKTFMLACGYHHKNIDDIIMEDSSDGYIYGN